MRTRPKNVETRAVGGPPEVAWSEDPNEQAEAILEASETISRRAPKSRLEEQGLTVHGNPMGSPLKSG